MPNDQLKLELTKLRERLHDPRQLRMIVTGLMLAVGYVGIGLPLSSRIEEATRKLAREQKREELAADVERLRTQVANLEARLPKDTDANEWVQYVLHGVRKFPLRLTALDSDSPQRVGPYEAVVLHLELQGAFGDLDSFLHWVESNQRLFRVETARITPAREKSERLVMQLTLLGLKE
jgi:Tfp pilus assembly protein PilO